MGPPPMRRRRSVDEAIPPAVSKVLDDTKGYIKSAAGRFLQFVNKYGSSMRLRREVVDDEPLPFVSGK